MFGTDLFHPHSSRQYLYRITPHYLSYRGAGPKVSITVAMNLFVILVLFLRLYRSEKWTLYGEVGSERKVEYKLDN